MAELTLDHHRGGAGEPMVLIHGIGSHWNVWEPLLPALESRYDVLAMSLPGYGDSPGLSREPTVPALTSAIERELDAAGLDRPHLVGNSLGGWIAAELAARGRASSVVAISPAGLWTRKELNFSALSLRLTRAATLRLAPHADRATRSAVARTALLGQVFGRPWRADPEWAAHAIRAFAGAPSFPATLDWVHRNGAMPEGLDGIECPFTILWGTRDFLLPPRQGPRWERIVPGARLVRLPGVGHAPMADDPELVTREILAATTRSERSPEPRASAPA